MEVTIDQIKKSKMVDDIYLYSENVLNKSIAKKNLNYSGKIIFKKNNDTNYLSDNPQRRKPCLKKSTFLRIFFLKSNL